MENTFDLEEVGRNIIKTTLSMLELETTFDISDEDLVFTENSNLVFIENSNLVFIEDNDIFYQTEDFPQIRIGKTLYPSWAPTIPFYFPKLFNLKHN